MAAKVADDILEKKQAELGIKPNGYVEQGTDDDTGHGRKRFEGQSIHGDTVRASRNEINNCYITRDPAPHSINNYHKF